MHPVEEMILQLKKLRNGEEVVCKHCGKGVMKPIGDYKTTHCYVCDNCGNKINLD